MIKILPVFGHKNKTMTNRAYQTFETRFPPNECYEYACKFWKESM